VRASPSASSVINPRAARPHDPRERQAVVGIDPADPKWIIATVTIPADVHPAVLDDAGRYTGWGEIADWVAGSTGRPVALVPLHDALAWRVDEGSRPR
jgi:hypothetical protein